MRARRIAILLYLCLSANRCVSQAKIQGITSCPGYNYNALPVYTGSSGTTGHTGDGDHAGSGAQNSSCTYTSIGE